VPAVVTTVRPATRSVGGVTDSTRPRNSVSAPSAGEGEAEGEADGESDPACGVPALFASARASSGDAGESTEPPQLQKVTAW
jgi:hypothetical protein